MVTNAMTYIQRNAQLVLCMQLQCEFLFLTQEILMLLGKIFLETRRIWKVVCRGVFFFVKNA